MPSHLKRAVAAATTGLLFVLFIFALALPAQAQCGTRPDPRWDSAGYSSWCSCMGGSYDYQTTACVGARSGAPSSSSSSSSGGAWGCRAEARNGAYGYGKDYATEAEARQTALNYCHSYSRGQRCTITFCRRGAGDSVMGPSRSAPAQRSAPARPSVRPATRAAYGCDLCYRKLVSDVRAGWASSRLISYVTQALAGYSNCKLKARGSCLQGDIWARTLTNSCKNFTVEKDYRDCIGRIAGF
jgi:hypothetical protein